MGSRIQHDPSLCIGYCARPFRTYWQPEPSVFCSTNRFASPGRPPRSWLCIGEEQGQRRAGTRGPTCGASGFTAWETEWGGSEEAWHNT